MDVSKQSLIARVQKYFLEFLTSYRELGDDGQPQGEFPYVEQAKRMLREKKRTLYVTLADLDHIVADSVSFDPLDLKNTIESQYMLVQDALNRAVAELLTSIDDPTLEAEVKQARATDQLKFTAAFTSLSIFCGIRDLRTDCMGRLTTVIGTVTRTTEIKPELLVGTWECRLCNREVTDVEQQFKVTEPPICPNSNCGNTSHWKLLGESPTTRWSDWQRIRLQENENEVPAGSMPRTMDIIVRDECCERCKPGDKVQITGCLIVVPDVPSMMNPSQLKMRDRRALGTRKDPSYSAVEGIRGLRGLGNRDLTYKLAFYGTFVDECSDWNRDMGSGENVRAEGDFKLSTTERERFQQIVDHVGPEGKKDCFDVIARSVAPSVYGCLDAKKGILLMLIGGVPKKTQEGIKLRGDINVCLLGDPATAKSALLKWTSVFLPRAVFTSGKSSTAAGLTASVTKDLDLDQEKVIEPGALMLADNGICCIDEFELMDQKDMTAIHEAMEQQTITLSKAGLQVTLNARASILASVLPQEVHYNPTLPLHKNCKLTPPIMSRFDLFFVLRDVHDEANDTRVARHILSMHRGREEEVRPPLTQFELQKYIRWARRMKPRMLPEAQHLLVKCYKKLREDRTYVRGSSGVTVRQLESLIRLSEAIARVHLSVIVSAEHVTEAYRLQASTLKMQKHENIELDGDELGPAELGAAAGAGADGATVSDAARAPRGRVRITYSEYQRIGRMLTAHLAREDKEGRQVKESDLQSWYLETIEHSIQSEAQLLEQQYLVQLVIDRLITKDRVILVYQVSSDPNRPEDRILIKHPNFSVEEEILPVRRA